MDRTAILLSCLNNDCSALILILKCLSVLMIEDLVLFKICPRELISYGDGTNVDIRLWIYATNVDICLWIHAT